MQSETDKKLLRSFRKAWDVSREFVEPHWELHGRLWKLWHGELPTEIADSTYTKVNLNHAHAAVQERIPKHLSTIFSTKDFFSLQAQNPEAEFYREENEIWLRDLFSNASKLNIRHGIYPTIQNVEIVGVGYREPKLCILNSRPTITSSPLDHFSVLPSPNGGLVNPHDHEQDAAVDWVHVIKWMRVSQIKELAKRGWFDKDAAEKLIARPQSSEQWVETYKDQFSNMVGGVVYDGPQSWRTKIMGQEGLDERRRVVFWYRRDRLSVIGEDQWVMYDGDPPFGKGTIPLVVYRAIPDQTNWFGFSTLEMTEDIILAILLNLNLRLQHLAQSMFPIKWIREDIAGNHPRSYWDTEPGATFTFPDSVENIGNAVWYDRATDVPAQAFQEDSMLRYFLQETGGMKNYAKGMGGQGTISNETATGITTIVAEANARFMSESEQLEFGGLREEGRLLMALGAKYETGRLRVRNPYSKDGFKWVDINADNITDQYDIITHGTAYLTDKRETVQKLLAFLPVLLNNPQMVNVPEALRQAEQVMDVFPQPEKLWIQQPAAVAPMGMGSLPGIGGMASAMDLGQQARSTANRQTVQAGTGRQVPANFSV